MPRKWSKAVPEGNGIVFQDTYVMLGGITLEELRRIISEALEKALDEPKENMRKGKPAFSRPGARSSAATSCHGSRRTN